MDAIDELAKLSQLLLLEREEEESRLQAIIEQKSIKERRDEGLCWAPVSVEKTDFAFGGTPRLLLVRNAGEHPVHELQKGSPVFLINIDDASQRYKGNITKLDELTAEVLLHEEDIPEGIREPNWILELRYDDRSFFEMERALNVAINMEAGEQRDLRDRLLGYKDLLPLEENSFPVSDQLNPSQQEAVLRALNAQDLAIVHGPPGTGKTTTLAEVIKHLAKQEKSILITAPSNTAVDNLMLKVAKAGLNPVRIGNSSRMTDEAVPFSLEHRLIEDKEYKLVKDLRKRAADLLDKAGKFKRNFGKEEREARRSARKEARDLEKEARNLERALEQKIIDQSDLVACTLIGAADVRIRSRIYDVIIIDEAGQSLEPASWVPILKGNKVVLAGDPHQLPPTVKSQNAAKQGLEVSLLEKAVERTSTSVLLEEQYRMNEKIMGFSNQWFYEGRLQAHESVSHRALTNELAIEFIDTAGCGYEEKAANAGVSKSNPEEISIIQKHLDELINTHGDQIEAIGVISPYRAQVEEMKTRLPQDERLIIQTVDGFQGQERDVIYISLVRSNENGELGFLTDYRRMNVAMTRAKRKLIVIGDSATIGQDEFYAAFLEYCEGVEGYRSAWEYV